MSRYHPLRTTSGVFEHVITTHVALGNGFISRHSYVNRTDEVLRSGQRREKPLPRADQFVARLTLSLTTEERRVVGLDLVGVKAPKLGPAAGVDGVSDSRHDVANSLSAGNLVWCHTSTT